MSLSESPGQRRWRKRDWFHWETANKILEYCGEKIIYHTEEEAHAALLKQQVKTDKPLRVYECPHGSHFHLTSQVPY